MRKSFISVRGGFSDSTGVTSCNTNMQYYEFDDKTRVLISNTLYGILEFSFDKLADKYKYDDYYEAPNWFCKQVISNVFSEKNYLAPWYTHIWSSVFEKISAVINQAPYNQVLDIVWFSCDWLNNNFVKYGIQVYKVMNDLFEQEYVGYRFINGKIVAITDKTEMEEIEQACSTSIEGCKSHIEKAVGFLSERNNKDYKNCIKESISAVECMCRIITEDDKATLGKAIKKLKDDGLKIHSSLEAAFTKLYGYTSDEGGIRHCEGLFVSDISFEEAKFMLVSCSAFVNYLIAEYGKTKQ